LVSGIANARRLTSLSFMADSSVLVCFLADRPGADPFYSLPMSNVRTPSSRSGSFRTSGFASERTAF
jgi:hypothetical protein